MCFESKLYLAYRKLPGENVSFIESDENFTYQNIGNEALCCGERIPI